MTDVDLPITVRPLGGLGEIGMNCMLLAHRGRAVIVDAGVQFPDPWEIGAERKLWDLDTIAAIAGTIEAVVITHGHEDHIGGLPWLLPALDASVPVFASPFTARLMEHRLREHDMWDEARIRRYQAGERFTAGPFDVEAIRVTHSLPDCCSLVLRCEDGAVLHTGDWKIDELPMDGEHFDRAAFERVGREGITVMLTDSTNALVPGRTRSETEVAQALQRHIEGHDERVIVTQFASNLHRLRGLVQAAEATDRKIAFAGRSLWRYLEAAASDRRHPIDPGAVVDLDQIDDYASDRLIVITTGSQGERQAVLPRAAVGQHRKMRLRQGDLVLHSARVIPGNEASVYKMFNELAFSGVKIVAGRRTDIHASGHARRDELAELMNLVRPKHVIPVHGEYTFLQQHAALAREHGFDATVVKNGETVGVGQGGAGSNGGRVRIARTAFDEPTVYYNDGPALGDRDAMLLTERKRIAWNGVVVVDLALSRNGAGSLKAEARVETRAVWTDDGRVPEELRRLAEAAVTSCPPKTPLKEVEEAVRMSLRRLCRKRTGKKPDVIVMSRGIDA